MNTLRQKIGSIPDLQNDVIHYNRSFIFLVAVEDAHVDYPFFRIGVLNQPKMDGS